MGHRIAGLIAKKSIEGAAHYDRLTLGPYQGCPVHEAGTERQSHGAGLIGPFEGSRWRGGCGDGLWDLNG